MKRKDYYSNKCKVDTSNMKIEHIPTKKHCIPDEVESQNDLNQYLIDSGAIKIYTAILDKNDKWHAEDQHGYVHFRGSEIECLRWINIKNTAIIKVQS